MGSDVEPTIPEGVTVAPVNLGLSDEEYKNSLGK